MRICYVLMLLSVLGVVGPFQGKVAEAQAPSLNYTKVFTLPRYGETDKNSSSSLDQIVQAHNRKLTENPAPKNRNRIVYLDGPDRYKPVGFPVKQGTPVVDGSGKIMGHLATTVRTVAINFGQHKQMGGVDHVMVFAAPMAEPVTGTGWIATSALLPSPERSQFSAVLAMNVADDAAMGDAPEKYQVHCGTTDGWDDGRLKILPNVSDRLERHEAATDYLVRPGGFCYLLTRLPGHGGVAGDTFSDGPIFVAAAGMPKVELPLYLPTDATDKEGADWNANKLPHEMEFRYGRVGQRYGWIASADLLPAKGGMSETSEGSNLTNN
jgi:hypothetical protein